MKSAALDLPIEVNASSNFETKFATFTLMVLGFELSDPEEIDKISLSAFSISKVLEASSSAPKYSISMKPAFASIVADELLLLIIIGNSKKALRSPTARSAADESAISVIAILIDVSKFDKSGSESISKLISGAAKFSASSEVAFNKLCKSISIRSKERAKSDFVRSNCVTDVSTPPM